MFLAYCFLYIAGCGNSGTTFFPPNPVVTVAEAAGAPNPELPPKPLVAGAVVVFPKPLLAVGVVVELTPLNPVPETGVGGVYVVPTFDGRARPPLFAPFNFS
jgi:predicted small lipoprotein YifL